MQSAMGDSPASVRIGWKSTRSPMCINSGPRRFFDLPRKVHLAAIAWPRGAKAYTHGIAVVNAFYENVNRNGVERRALDPDEAAQNVVLEFKLRPTPDMLVACLWSRWAAAGELDMLLFAAITDEPPPEVAAARHDRCIVPIRPEHVDAWSAQILEISPPCTRCSMIACGRSTNIGWRRSRGAKMKRAALDGPIRAERCKFQTPKAGRETSDTVRTRRSEKTKGLAGIHQLTPAYLGSPTWARTRDLRINSPALYQLSYRGTTTNYNLDQTR